MMLTNKKFLETSNFVMKLARIFLRQFGGDL